MNAPVVGSRWRPAAVHIGLVLFGAAIIARAAQLQLLEHQEWAQVALEQHVKDQTVEAPRGPILDATGEVLVETREEMTLQIAAHELVPFERELPGGKRERVDPRQLVRKALRDYRVPEADIRRALGTRGKWITLPQRFLAADLERLAGLPGVYRSRILRRDVNVPQGLRGLVGVLDASGKPVSGIESELDPFLRGESGHNPVVIDGSGRRIGSPMLTAVAARPGYTVTLTINRSLQEIADQQLAIHRERTGATGGDVVILDPRDGAILALAGVRNGKPAVTSTPLAEAYEPGSVMKPFVIARLLDLDLTSPDETIDTENGKAIIGGRQLDDEHKAPVMPVRDVVRFSSNIGTAKLAERLSRTQQYLALRDFGFGTPTGVPYPAESRGVLSIPSRWTKVSQSSIAIGYEMMATPLQIAAGYAAFANGGELLQPVLVREVRDEMGRIVFNHQRRVVRRPVSAEVAATMRTMLKSVVDSGTAQAADLDMFDVAGKSGTARRQEKGKGYAAGYNSSFASMFPVQDPQYVIVARLIDSQKGYFGGIVAGELVKGILEAALATREASLDRNALASLAKPLPPPPPKPVSPARLLAIARDSARRDSLKAPEPPTAEPLPAAGRVVVDLAAGIAAEEPGGRRPAGRSELRPVPSVFGLDARQAARTLFAAGFQVTVAAGKAAGRDVRTRPAAGALLRAGSTVQLETPK